MTPVVLHVEVAVPALGQRQLGQPTLEAGPLVAQFMGGVDGDAPTRPMVRLIPTYDHADSEWVEMYQHAHTNDTSCRGMHAYNMMR